MSKPQAGSNIVFDLRVGYDADADMPTVTLGVQGSEARHHVFTLGWNDAVDLGTSLVRSANASLFFRAAHEYAEQRVADGDVAGANALTDFCEWVGASAGGMNGEGER